MANMFGVDGRDAIVTACDFGNQGESGSDNPCAVYNGMVNGIDGMDQAVMKLTDDKRPEVIAAAVEFTLEAPHLSPKLNCDRSGESAVCKR